MLTTATKKGVLLALSFLVSALPVLACPQPTAVDCEAPAATDAKALESLEFLRAETDLGFWQQLHASVHKTGERFNKEYIDGDAWKKSAVALGAGTSGLAVIQGSTAEIAMRLYKVPSPFHALAMMYTDIQGNLPRFAMKYLDPAGKSYARLAAKSAAIEALRASALKAGAASFAKDRLFFRVLGLGGGMILGAGLGYLMWVDETAGPEMSEMRPDYYERIGALAVMFETGATDADILNVASRQPEFRANLIAMAEMLSEMKVKAGL